jgi:hypothetical protein
MDNVDLPEAIEAWWREWFPGAESSAALPDINMVDINEQELTQRVRGWLGSLESSADTEGYVGGPENGEIGPEQLFEDEGRRSPPESQITTIETAPAGDAQQSRSSYAIFYH